jgi:hypothetical protein
MGLSPRQERLLRLMFASGAAILLGGLAMVGFAVALRPGKAPPPTAANAQVFVATADLALPAGAVIKSLGQGERHLAVHFDGPGGAGILVLDLVTGKVASRLRLTN